MGTYGVIGYVLCTCGVHRYVRCTWVCAVYMGTCGVHGYVRCTWVCVVYMGTCGIHGYVQCTWVRRGYMGTVNNSNKMWHVLVCVVSSIVRWTL